MKIYLAPIIHGRTLEIDFRENLIAIPDDFDQGKVDWAKDYILNSTDKIETLRNNIRHILFSDKTHIVVGVSAYLTTLINSSAAFDKLPVKDSHGRQMYVFIGFAMKRDLLKNINLFEIPLDRYINTYQEYVLPRWNEHINEKNANNPTSMNYALLDVNGLDADNNDLVGLLKSADIETEFSRINEEAIYICRADADTDNALYKLLLSKILNGEENLSLCTLMSDRSQALRSKYSVASCSSEASAGWYRRYSKKKSGNVNVHGTVLKKELEKEIFSRENPIEYINALNRDKVEDSTNIVKGGKINIRSLINETANGLVYKFRNGVIPRRRVSHNAQDEQMAVKKELQNMCARCPYRQDADSKNKTGDGIIDEDIFDL